jgi:hypothetical protein
MINGMQMEQNWHNIHAYFKEELKVCDNGILIQ